MSDRHEAARRRLEDAVLRGDGFLEGALRAAIATGGDLPADLQPLVAKVKGEAYRVTDADLDALRLRYNEDQIFEIVVSAALGAGLARIEAFRAALEKA
jgi:hypothetical protein